MSTTGQNSFWLVALTGAGYFLLKRRPFDLFSLGFFSALVYFSPGFIGVTNVPGLVLSVEAIGESAYSAMTVVLASLLAMTFARDAVSAQAPDYRQRVFHLRGDEWVSWIALLVGFLALIGTLSDLKDAVSSLYKEDILNNIGRWHILFEYSVSLAALTFYQTGQRIGLLCAVAMLSLDIFLFEFRSAAVITLLATGVLGLAHHRRLRLLGKTRLIVIGALALLFMLFAKQFLFAFRYAVSTGDAGSLWEQLVNLDSYLLALVSAEPSVTVTILNAVTKLNFSVPFGNLADAFVAQVPFANLLGADPRGFNELFQPVLFPEIEYGMANNIWAQMYSLGGLFGVMVFSIAYALVLWGLSLLIGRSSRTLQAMLALAGTYWAFYIHRNDLLYQLLLERRVILVFLMIYLASWLLNVAARRPAVRAA